MSEGVKCRCVSALPPPPRDAVCIKANRTDDANEGLSVTPDCDSESHSVVCVVSDVISVDELKHCRLGGVCHCVNNYTL